MTGGAWTAAVALIVARVAAPRGLVADALLALNLFLPSLVKLGHDVNLTCEYDLENDKLYSIKWYKDKHEFYSFTPSMKDSPKRFFAVHGVRTIAALCDARSVWLAQADRDSQGEYKCQVSGEAPLFKTVMQHKNLRVAVAPLTPPRISKLSKNFTVATWLHLNCTSGLSSPAQRLQWLVNGGEASENMLRPYPPVLSNDDPELKATVLALEFWVAEEHFLEGQLRVECLSTMEGGFYGARTEVLTVGFFALPDKVLQATSDSSSHWPTSQLPVAALLSLSGNVIGTTIAIKSSHFYY